jgi:hypothetical protein
MRQELRQKRYVCAFSALRKAEMRYTKAFLELKKCRRKVRRYERIGVDKKYI